MRITLVILILSSMLNAQGVFEPLNSDIYNYLKTLSVKGIITFDYEIKPLPRVEIARKLLEVDKQNYKMTGIEKELLTYYLQDFQCEIKLINSDFESDIKPEFFITDKDNRIRFFEYAGKDFSFLADPIC